MPIDFVLIRASDVPDRVADEETVLKAGITGSDIIWEAGLGKNYGEEIPIYTFNPDAKKSALYVGITKEFSNLIRQQQSKSPCISDLSGKKVATKYCRIASDVFSEKNAGDIDLLYVAGKDEAMPYLYPDCCGILGIISTGTTIKKNDIDVLETFYQVTINMIEATDKISQRDANILDDFREKIAVAIQKRRMI